VFEAYSEAGETEENVARAVKGLVESKPIDSGTQALIDLFHESIKDHVYSCCQSCDSQNDTV
jgi:hypothetical protein